ncbi:MAG: queuosine precursor transporter [Ahrensia sp.]
MLIQKNWLIFVCAMCAVVAASNVLVQYPVMATIGSFNLADLLTWGAFTYPVAFLITDMTNRRFGPKAARMIVLSGFVLAVALSIWLATPRIAVASGSAFLIAQLLDVSIFDRLRRASWWKAPLISTVIGSVVDTAIFFSLAFSSTFAFGAPDAFATEMAPFLGAFALETPRWVSWAGGDLAVKLLVGVAMLLPYGLFLRSKLIGAEYQTHPQV